MRSGGGSGTSALRAPSVSTHSSSALSATVRVRTPATDRPCQCSSCGASGTRPRCGLSPTRPQAAAGIRIEPPPSEAVAAATIPEATAAAEPPLLPPVECAGSQGLRVAPQVCDSVKGHSASSGRCVVPMTTAPAARSRRTCSASRAATGSGEPVPIEGA